MYEQIFNLNKPPFTATPFTPNYYAATAIAQAIWQLQSGIERSTGPSILTGAAGTGKSLVLALLAEQFGSAFQVVSLVSGGWADRKDLLQNILFELELPYRDLSEGELRLSLIDCLKSDHCGPQGLLLLIDDAHGLSSDQLDELRLITTFVRNGQPHVSLVMAGLPSLEDHLIDTKSESFNQRITTRCYLFELSSSETIEYVLTHIERAGGNGEELFTAESLNIVHQTSHGVARVVSQICDASLAIAAEMGSARVTADIVREGWNRVQSIPGASPQITPTPVSSDGTIDEDNESMVLEFGSLDDEVDSSFECSIESDQEPGASVPDRIENTVPPADQIQANEILELRSEVEEYRLQAVGETDSQNDLILRGDGDVTSDREQPSVQWAMPAIHGDAFENPFEETFSQEEKVVASFFPEVSEQNLSSLTLTPEHLNSLDALPATMMLNEDGTPVDQLRPICVQEGSRNASESDAPESHKRDSIIDLRLSAEGLANLERVESDIQQIQQDFVISSSTEDTSLQRLAFVDRTNLQPVEELMQDFPVMHAHSYRVENEPEDAGSDAEEEELESPVSAADDDQDIMIIDRPEANVPHEKVVHSTGDVPAEFETIRSTGRATRMNYQDLFMQLRNSD